MKAILLIALLLIPRGAIAQLIVTVSLPKMVGQKTVISMAIRNGLPEKIESARAVTFLMDEQGKMVGQNTQWIIGGTKERPSLADGATNVFNFVITADKPIPTTNLTARVTFTRLILEGGKSIDPVKNTQIQTAEK